ncbi:energy-coupling factor transporter ATPase [Ecytonucleospora hepatopenaei]|uniref:Energy-coupling factor transporter ATPase n=1 Tax=Ecytonucleospora hepatopenaei TaxID=646526 RepID=A0A1W0E3N5_9MICR|nr:energy-coupling factor transporter ATPase [Ecytonucleospora hepatopenaei]
MFIGLFNNILLVKTTILNDKNNSNAILNISDDIDVDNKNIFTIKEDTGIAIDSNQFVFVEQYISKENNFGDEGFNFPLENNTRINLKVENSEKSFEFFKRTFFYLAEGSKIKVKINGIIKNVITLEEIKFTMINGVLKLITHENTQELDVSDKFVLDQMIDFNNKNDLLVRLNSKHGLKQNIFDKFVKLKINNDTKSKEDFNLSFCKLKDEMSIMLLNNIKDQTEEILKVKNENGKNSVYYENTNLYPVFNFNDFLIVSDDLNEFLNGANVMIKLWSCLVDSTVVGNTIKEIKVKEVVGDQEVIQDSKKQRGNDTNHNNLLKDNNLLENNSLSANNSLLKDDNSLLKDDNITINKNKDNTANKVKNITMIIFITSITLFILVIILIILYYYKYKTIALDHKKELLMV